MQKLVQSVAEGRKLVPSGFFPVFWLTQAKQNAGLIAGIITGFTALGAAYAFFAAPVYTAKAIITPKTAQKQPSLTGTFAGLASLGGLGSVQLGTDKADITKLIIIGGGWELARDVIEKNALLPALFPGEWDVENSRWKSAESADIPDMRRGMDRLLSKVMRIESNETDNTLEISAHIYDPDLAVRLVNLYLRELDAKLRQKVISESKLNQKYLENQLENTQDPLIMGKIQNILAFEIEREMLVGNSSIDVLIGPLKPLEREKPHRLKTILLCFLTGIFLTGMLVYWKASKPSLSA
jgi:hypothetical protein